MKDALPFTQEQVEALAAEHPTPLYVYDAAGIRGSTRLLHQTYDVPGSRGHQNYFAVKALPNPHILKLNKGEGQGTDCSSLPELLMSEIVGITGENCMFTSNDTPDKEFVEAQRLRAITNLDDITHIDTLDRLGIHPEIACFRYNPGPRREGNRIIGKPEEAKYGVRHDQIVEAYIAMKARGCKRFGLHTMVVSNQKDWRYLVGTAAMLFDLVAEISRQARIDFEFVNLGGGVGIPYRPEHQPVDMVALHEGIIDAYDKGITARGLPPLKILTECGRFVTGPHGYLVTSVRHVMDKYKKFVGVDACMANLMRPGMYSQPGDECYHHLVVLGKEPGAPTEKVDVVGSLCEGIDKFAIDRTLPKMQRGDRVVIKDAGAHGWAMGFQYNAKLRCAEFLMEDGKFRMIRRAETPDDYFATWVDRGSLSK